MKYSQWLDQEFIPFYVAESEKEQQIDDFFLSKKKILYICPLLMIYENQVTTTWQLEHAATLQSRIDYLLQEESRKFWCLISTLSPLIGDTRENRIEWLIREMEEAKKIERIQEHYDGHS